MGWKGTSEALWARRSTAWDAFHGNQAAMHEFRDGGSTSDHLWRQKQATSVFAA
jgi:hypothetical protein